MDVQMFLVGGFVRDHLLGVQSKDADFSVVADSFEAMEKWLADNGFEVFVSNPEFFTLRARGPKGFEFAGFQFGNQTFDFVWARQDGPSSDGRRPDFVLPGTLMDDLSRRDFTMNALAMDSQGNIIDLFNGQEDLEAGILTAVGDPEVRFTEDSLRILRGIRFSVTRGFALDRDTVDAMFVKAHLLENVSAERIREELTKMFRADLAMSLRMMERFPFLLTAMLDAGISLKPTLEKM